MHPAKVTIYCGIGEVAKYKLQHGEDNKSYSYTYDPNGNITTISLNGSLNI